MLKFVRAKDVASLQRLLRAHIGQTRESYLEVLERREAEANAAAA